MPVCLAAFLAVGIGCNNSQSTDSADSTSTTTDADTSTMATGDMSADTNMSADSKFATEAASGGMMEVELGQLAATNASSANVKKFGQMMVTDHSKANTELKAVAAQKNITLPTAPMEDHQKHIDELKAKTGADFDKAYVDMMVDDHQEDISKFEDEAKNGNDADLKAFASKTLPVLKKHLQAVKAIQDGMK